MMFDQKMELELLTAAWVGRRVWGHPNHRDVGKVRSIFRGSVTKEWMARVEWQARDTTAELLIHLELVDVRP